MARPASISKNQPKTLVLESGEDTHEYQLLDEKDWCLWEDTILQIKASDGQVYYWPLDSVRTWRLK